jgi:hypothetical protein
MRIVHSTAVVSFLVLAGCAVTPGSGAGEERTEETSAALINGWAVATHGTTCDFTGFNLNLHAGESCFLNTVTGNLSSGTDTQGTQPAEAEAAVIGSILMGEGGDYFDQNTDRNVCAEAPVEAGATCVNFLPVASASWQSAIHGWSVPPPVLVTSLGGASRQCFLTKVTGAFTAWNSASQVAKVNRVTTADSTHPTPGWYVESNAFSSADGSPVEVGAACYDFPVGSGFWRGQFGGENTFQLTFDTTHENACGLTFIQGAFDADDFSNGVNIIPPSNGPFGNWFMHVSSGKVGGAVCVE